MPQHLQLPLSEADTALLLELKARTGVDPATLGHLVAHAMMGHIRKHQSLTLPMALDAPPDCQVCPHAKHIGTPNPRPTNILTGPWHVQQ